MSAGWAGILATRKALREFRIVNDVATTRFLVQPAGSATAADWLEQVYDELRKLAAVRLAREWPGQSLQATALVHEAFIRITDGHAGQMWPSRAYFFAAAAEAIRRILVEKSRHKASQRAGGKLKRVDFARVEPLCAAQPQIDLHGLDEALEKLAETDRRAATTVNLRYFAGLTIAETAAALGVSVATVENDWAYARSWLRMRMGDIAGSSGA